MATYECKYCGAHGISTPQGLNSHVMQTAYCRTKMELELAKSDSGSEEQQLPPSPTNIADDFAMDVDDGTWEEDFPPDTALDPSMHDDPATEMPTSQRATVEDVEDEGDTQPASHRWVKDYRWIEEWAGNAGTVKGKAVGGFEAYRREQEERNQEPWYPFESKDEWELARWLMTSGVSQKKMDSFLELNSETHHFVKINATHLYRVYKNSDGTNREYNEMWTADWWWETQGFLPDGATIAPVILSSDKTNLSRFSGDKQAWPVYLSIGNIDKATRRQPTARAMVLLGYIPVCKLECFTKARRSLEGYQLFHECMRKLLEPLIEAGQKGVDIVCADGFIRTAYPILAAYIADYPEQCLIACCQENTCPQCTVKPKERGEYRIHSVLRDPEKTINIITQNANGDAPREFKEQNLRQVNPFWRDLPHCNIFKCITPDLLHQLHKGLFNDHIVSWATKSVTGQEEEIDERFRCMSLHPTLRHFKKGVSLTSQWTGTEHKNMEKVFLGVLAGATDTRVLQAVRGVLDFTYYAHFETHCDETLAQLDEAWRRFHENKEIFEELGIREHFNISKLHNIKHYLDSIRSLGTADGFNTEGTERLHIDLAKMGYNASNKKEYIKQMTVWLRRQESIHRFCRYLQWAVPDYVAEVGRDEGGQEPEEEKNAGNEEEEEEEEVKDNNRNVSFSIAKKPAIVGPSVKSIIDDYGATDFLFYLDSFIHDTLPSCSVTLTESTKFSLYKRLVLTLPPIHEVSSQPVRDVVHAVKGAPQVVTTKGIKKAVAARLARYWYGFKMEKMEMMGL
ncbi:hypothetical protein BDZ97DRAFT_1927768 [Flammula alnicola]|nr:hypothetical protein BDZ97DRAFT_1927768 [Flammula alnicola]